MKNVTQSENRWGYFWKDRRNGESVTNIAKKNNVSVQAVYKALNSKNTKIENLLLTTAKNNRIHVYCHDRKEGFLWGYSTSLKTDVYITISPKTGNQVWYEHKGVCRNCNDLLDCLWILKTEAAEREIIIPKKMESPTDIALFLFDSIKEKLAWNESVKENARKYSPEKQKWEKKAIKDC